MCISGRHSPPASCELAVQDPARSVTGVRSGLGERMPVLETEGGARWTLEAGTTRASEVA